MVNPSHTINALTARVSAIEHQTARGLGAFDRYADLFPIKENTRDEIRPLESFGSHVCNGRNPGDSARGYLKPGYCAQFYPNAKCQNKGPNNPYTGDYQLRNQLRGALPGAPIPARRARRRIAAATAAGITATEDLQSGPPFAGAFIRSRYPSP